MLTQESTCSAWKEFPSEGKVGAGWEGNEATGQIVSRIWTGFFFYSGENKGIVDSEKPGADCARHGGATRAAWQAPYI